MALLSGFPGNPSSLPVGQYFGLSAFTAYPYSRGHLHITGLELDDKLDFKIGFFSDARDIDIKKNIWTYKKQREIVRRMEIYRGEVPAGHPPFLAGSNAACIEIGSPLRGVQDIKYPAQDDTILEMWLRENVNATWHSVGTCTMAPPEKMGVVDAKLSVRGVEA